MSQPPSHPLALILSLLLLTPPGDARSQAEAELNPTVRSSPLGKLVGEKPKKTSSLLQQVLTTPEAGTAAPEVGIWSTSQSGGNVTRLALADDGRYRLDVEQLGRKLSESGTYEFTGDTLVLRADGAEASAATRAAAHIEGERLSLTLGGNEMVLHRESAATVVGKWRGTLAGSEIELTLGPDGSYEMAVGQGGKRQIVTGTYRREESRLFLKPRGSTAETEIAYRLDSATQMTIQDGDETAVLALVDSPAATPPAPPAVPGLPGGGLVINLPPPASPGQPAPSPQAPQPAPAGQTPAAMPANPLIGVWSGILEGTIAMTLAFYDDANYGIRLAPQNAPVQQNEGTYRIADGVLYTLPIGNQQEAAFPIRLVDPNTLSIDFGTGQVSLARQPDPAASTTQPGPAPAPAPVPAPTGQAPGTIEPALVGVWILPEKYRVDFDSNGTAGTYLDREPSILVLAEDGTYLFGTEQAFRTQEQTAIEQSHWCAKQAVLYLYNGTWNAVAQYQVAADSLTLRGGDGSENVFERAREQPNQ
ncbi:MAG: hypothetical protein JNK37_03745 [Verrucomicrobiales bacterium]|nr:hypothetical protein [Verrucomicrobiales bacterium]